MDYATPLFSGFDEYNINTDPYTAFGRYLEGKNKPQQDFLMKNYSRYQLGYTSEASRNPLLNFLDYLNGKGSMGFNADNEYKTSTSSQRGENPRNFVGRVKYVGF